MSISRPQNHDPEPRSLFEAWMGMSAEEWDALGAPGEEQEEDEPKLL